ncbi:uncharacterized protein B0P05DRAFT_556528 [Gilbertella persicaria]|uniref:uncharacterized protein n=1 Tax=Gilbertella persicaria TaxID=101096 RepID=UPI00221FB0C9|nr:uncharacterized protein B0P05DRAFT_556528 [Gilbertella persicaria]KAI8062320.1 hypothetical protein B0P05DRAFT_556528 [Gilbertella persicaria]
MEAFLSTLPPYVHEFLDKHPPTDVFNLLRELICFAVLYSQDRERINQATEEQLYLIYRQQIVKEVHHQEEEELEHEAVVPGIMDAIKEEEHETEPIVAEKPKLPNTFPEWWGHREFEPPKKQEKKPAEASVEHATVVHSNTTSATSTPVTTPPPPQQQSHATTWISCKKTSSSDRFLKLTWY